MPRERNGSTQVVLEMILSEICRVRDNMDACITRSVRAETDIASIKDQIHELREVDKSFQGTVMSIVKEYAGLAALVTVIVQYFLSK
jgi:hypothetical protein